MTDARTFHTSSPRFRESIRRDGLIPRVGPSYETHYDDGTPDQVLRPAVFLAVGWENRFDSCSDDDVYEVNIEGLELVEEDPKFGAPGWMMCFETIEAWRLTLIFEGTGRHQDDD